MGLDDKIGNAAEKLGGKGKEATGEATGDESLAAEGRGDQAKGDLKQAGEKVKDAFKKD
ncbi:CsbD family protein [Pseudarthrobacter sp. NamB4]|uniref:CsbD family protein n=1 Tax=Pseudarthrobacter sp. NamB4 TaxID=2576837 RepID=UPI0010FD6173|nr:CsbD family protein [Pseudarthrobacter sp. NamB4]TLM72928.1 CsbD family protein [Pseudarthrobacter sp. NamB4]